MHVTREKKHCTSLLVLKNMAELKKSLLSHLLKDKATKPAAAHTPKKYPPPVMPQAPKKPKGHQNCVQPAVAATSSTPPHKSSYNNIKNYNSNSNIVARGSIIRSSNFYPAVTANYRAQIRMYQSMAMKQHKTISKDGMTLNKHQQPLSIR
jgi:hypothetical protein